MQQRRKKKKISCASPWGPCDDNMCSHQNPSFCRVKHVKYQRIAEKKDDFPVEGTHLSVSEDDLKRPKYATTKDLKSVQEYFQSEVSEVIFVVEGIDPSVSGTFQALQSYRFEDIVWDNTAHFHPCIGIDDTNKILRADLNKFHDIVITGGAASRNYSVRTHDSFIDTVE